MSTPPASNAASSPKLAANPDDSTVSIELSRPLATRRHLKLARPTAAELRTLPRRVLQTDAKNGGGSRATWGDMLGMISGCSGIPLAELDALAAADVRAAVEVLNGFLDPNLVQEGQKRVKVGADGRTTITLARPVKLGSERLERLELAPCTARHLRDLKLDPDLGDLLQLGGLLSAQADAIVDRLDVEDALVLIEVAASFFADSRATGG